MLPQFTFKNEGPILPAAGSTTSIQISAISPLLRSALVEESCLVQGYAPSLDILHSVISQHRSIKAQSPCLNSGQLCKTSPHQKLLMDQQWHSLRLHLSPSFSLAHSYFFPSIGIISRALSYKLSYSRETGINLMASIKDLRNTKVMNSHHISI